MLPCPFVFLTVVAGYFLSLAIYFINFESKKDSLAMWGKRVVASSLLLHFVFIAVLFFRAGGLVITSLSDAIYLGSFLILAASFFMEWRYKARYLMLFSLPIVLLFCLLAVLLSEKSEPIVLAPDSWWFWFHTSLILSGFAGLIIAVSGAVMYLLQSAQLKSKHLGRIFLKLPSLNALDRLHFSALSWGVILFSLGILSGILWAKDMKELGEVLKDPKVVLSFLTCLLYWVVLSFRLSALRRGQKIAVGTVLVFALLFVTFFAPSGFHKGF